MKAKRMDVKLITTSALLTALAIIIPLLPIPKIIIGPFTATFAAHVPGILAMFISPFAVICTAVGSALGFLPLGPVVSIRALTHLIFGLAGYAMLKKNFNIFLVAGVTMLLHGLSEVFVALLFGNAFMAIWQTVGCFTMIHHCIDFAFAMVVYGALSVAKVFNTPVNVKSFRG